MEERTQDILTTVVREYIRRAEPIGSEWLAANFDFGIASATMRQELARLDEAGFLLQPHTSAGRIPTDNGYRFFVNLLLAEQRRTHERLLQAMLRQVEELERERQDIMRVVAQWLGEHSRNLAFVGSKPHTPGHVRLDPLYVSGLKRLLGQPEFGEPQYLMQALSILGALGEQAEDFTETISDEETSVFIGRENPFREARLWSMVIGQFDRNGKDGVVAIVGPTRMDYGRNIALVEAMRRFLAEHVA